MTGMACYRMTKMWTIAGFPARPGIDTLGLAMKGEFQISRRQVCERGLRGGEIDGNIYCRTGALGGIGGGAEGCAISPNCAVYPDESPAFCVSAADPW